MKKLALIVFCLFICSGLFGATSFTEFYTDTATGANINAGSTTGAALLTAANGNWDSSTGVFICAGATDLSAVTVGMWASVYIDAATTAVFVSRITAVVDATDTITVSLTIKSGTAPTTSATARSITIGGVWKGPNAAESFPFGFVQSTMVNASSHPVRVNIKSGTAYSITAAMTHANTGPIRWQGYTTTVGDMGRATIDGGTAGASYVLLTLSAVNNDVVDLIFQNNGATGSAAGVAVSAAECQISRCVFNSVRGFGLNVSVNASPAIECESYACNQSNTSATAGMTVFQAVRCISHDNVGSNSAGFILPSGAFVERCIADSNGEDGFKFTGTTQLILIGCDSYNNGADGIDMTSASAQSNFIESCNLINNTGWGINSSGAGPRNGSIFNCAFGSGTQANDSGAITAAISGINEIGTITYASNLTPWVDPANGDFRINLAAAMGTGRGTFTQTAPSYTGTIGYPDIGAVQHRDGGGNLSSASAQ